MSIEDDLKMTIRDIPNYPKEGILFKDLTPIVYNPKLSQSVVNELSKLIELYDVDALCCLDARGFWFGLSVALHLNIPMVPIRKSGKLPYLTYKESYNLEYGTSEIEIHQDAISKGMRVVIHDDLLATGGTASAAANLIERCGGKVVCFSFVVELGFLEGRNRLNKFDAPILSICKY